jgi:ABC-type uncharacterized transport system YnjBCD ATPase subunit
LFSRIALARAVFARSRSLLEMVPFSSLTFAEFQLAWAYFFSSHLRLLELLFAVMASK